MKPTSLPPVRHCGAGEGRSLSCQEKRAVEPVVHVWQLTVFRALPLEFV